jgi:hypothetical protein
MSTRKSTIAFIATVGAVLMMAASPASAGNRHGHGNGHGFKYVYVFSFTHQNNHPSRDCSQARCFNPNPSHTQHPQAPKPNPYATTTAQNLRPSMPGYVWVGDHWERVKAAKVNVVVVRDHRTGSVVRDHRSGA